MPLPKPPAKKGDLLRSADYEAQAAPRADKRALKTRSAEAPAQATLELLDTAPPATAARAPAAKPAKQTAPGAAPAAAPAVAAPATGYAPLARTPAPAPRARKPRSTGPAKLFVLDTNVLMHDPMSLFRFEEHDVFLPMITLEELDGHKKGMSEVARSVRQVSRELDALAALATKDGQMDAQAGIPLAGTGHRDAGGKLYFQTTFLDFKLPPGLPQGKADNQILGVVQSLREQQPGREIVLVSKDINMRVKARALGLPAEDYFNDKTLEDGDLLYTGVLPLPADFWDRHGKTMESWQQGGHTYYRISGPLVPALMINQFVFLEVPGAPSLYARVAEITGKTAVLKTLRDYTHGKNSVWGVTARNREQNFALNLLMDPECDFITLTGTAGTGKTLMTLASGLSQVLDERRYSEIIVTRVTVPVGDDIGFLPGNEEEKMGPWMGALDDNLEVLARSDGSAGEWGRAATNDLVRSKIKIKSLNFMRGRTFLNKFVIIDEAQNLTPKQMKTLITRAGPGTKIVCLGNLAQIDTPYLTEGSSGLTYAVDRFKGWPHGGHVTLARGERSRLADFASDVL
ncbi:phosphate starvation-inducible protein PhoH [beta proteobacterium AAP121]|nr:phosphate starvation-inducible protein PhoH [beta proteobacterium AAP65]KPG00572.1 phosphate starvation-inducible protein PhoH [beta proteobacterium AAP121]